MKKSAGRPPMDQSKRKVKPNITLDPKLIEAAKSASKEEGFSAWVERAIRAELQRSAADEPQNIHHLPYYGTVAAGLPGCTVDTTDDVHAVAVPYDPATHYVLRVRGESMEPDYEDGSHIVCRKLKSGEFATKGQDVICSDASGSYFKRLIYTKDGPKGDTPRKAKPQLASINPDYGDVVPLSDCPIVAVVVGMA
jgi:SOS-response transcriptional repressor LexA